MCSVERRYTGPEISENDLVRLQVDDVDVELESMKYMPNTKALLADKGITFSNMYASVPVCCPSR